MPDVLGPPNPYAATPPSALGMAPPPPIRQDILDKLFIMVYGGKPLTQSFLDAHAVADTAPNSPGRDIRIGNLATTRNPLYGGKIEYRPDSWQWGTPLGTVHGAVNLDAWHQNPDFPVQRQTGGTAPFIQSMDVLSANFSARLPQAGGWTPYLGLGPAIVRNQQGDQYGFSPPSVNLGAHLYGGIEKQLTDRLSAFGEAKYLNSAITPHDSQGALRGTFNELAGVAGLNWKFGGGE